MTIEFHSPSCQKVLKTADDKAGIEARCPGCGELVIVPSPDLNSPEQLLEVVDDVGDAVAAPGDSAGPAPAAQSGGASGEMMPCPMCGAEIRKAATRCRFCGESLVRQETEGGLGRIEAGEILTRTWNIFQKNLGILVGSALVLLGITVVSVLAGYAGIFVAVISLGAAGRGRPGPDVAAIVAFAAIVVLFVVFLFALNAFLQGGYNSLLLRIARGERAELSEMFSGGRFFWRLFWGNVLFMLLTYVGFALVIVPAVFVMLIFWPFSFVIVDQNAGVLESFRKSRELSSGNLLAIFVLGLAMLGINMLAQLACYIGMIFTIPFGSLIFAVAYCRMNGQATGGARRA